MSQLVLPWLVYGCSKLSQLLLGTYLLKQNATSEVAPFFLLSNSHHCSGFHGIFSSFNFKLLSAGCMKAVTKTAPLAQYGFTLHIGLHLHGLHFQQVNINLDSDTNSESVRYHCINKLALLIVVSCWSNVFPQCKEGANEGFFHNE